MNASYPGHATTDLPAELVHALQQECIDRKERVMPVLLQEGVIGAGPVCPAALYVLPGIV